jgi:pimeloyl-ACP methyl ester carboxylesterase
VPGPDGASVPVTVDGLLLATIVYTSFYAPDGPAAIPALVAAAAAGDFGFLAGGGMTPELPAGAPIAYGQQASILCAEDVARSSPIDRPDGDTLAGELLDRYHPVLGEGFAEVCAAWDVPAVGDELDEPVDVDVPALIVTGRFDQITPPAWGEQLGERFDHDVTVTMQAQGHSPLLNAGPCGFAILEQFLAAPNWRPDLSCAWAPPDFAAAAAS